MRSKNFLIGLIITFVAASAFLLVRNASFQNSQNVPAEPRNQVIEKDLLQDCTLTQEDTGGPYYIANMPFRDKLAPENSSGPQLTIRGKVLLKDCVTPVANAVLDIWHADENGVYQENSYRGKVQADDNGNYEFTTILPSPYGSGGVSRPRHIHYKVLRGGKELLTSQMYFDKELISEVGQTRLVYLNETQENRRLLENLRKKIREKTSAPVSVGFGPRYLHSTGQLYKGGGEGVFLILTEPNAVKVPIPGKRFDFGILHKAQARGDFEALAAKRRVLRLELAPTADSLRALANAVDKTHGRFS